MKTNEIYEILPFLSTGSRRLMPKYFLIAAISLLISIGYGKTFSVEGPPEVNVGSTFEIKVILNEKDDEIRIYGDNFKFLGQSGVSKKKSLVNGRFSENKIYFYRLKPRLPRRTKLPKNIFVTIVVGDQRKSLKVKIVQPQKKKIARIPSSQQRLNILSKDSVLIENHLSKKKLLINETAILETVVHANYALDSYQVSKRYKESCYQLIPVENFTYQRRPRKTKKKYYLSSTISKHIIYSPKKGECTIEAIPFRITLLVPGLFLKKKTIEVKPFPIKFTVTDYPESGQPDDFQTHYGDYRLSLKLSKSRTEIDAPVKLSAIVSGTGNFATLNEPKINLLPEFTITKNKIIDDFSPNEYGIMGSKTYNYYLTPNEVGYFQNTPEVIFSYYSPTAQNYKTLRKRVSELTVLPYSGYSPSVDTDLNLSSLNREEPIKLYPLYTAEIKDSNSSIQIGGQGVGGLYHLIGFLSSLLIWVSHKSKYSSNQPKIKLKELRKKFLYLSDLHNSKGSAEPSLWADLKRLTTQWIEIVYHPHFRLSPEKSWDKEIKQLISSTSSSQEKNILINLRDQIMGWEANIYNSYQKNKGDKKSNSFSQEIDTTKKSLEKLLHHLSSKPPKSTFKKPPID